MDGGEDEERGGRGALALAHDRGVGLLDLLEPAGGLLRAAVVVGVVELDQPPVGRAKLLVGDAGADAEDLVRVGAQMLASGRRRKCGRTERCHRRMLREDAGSVA